jgi:hypothetical protein
MPLIAMRNTSKGDDPRPAAWRTWPPRIPAKWSASRADTSGSLPFPLPYDVHRPASPHAIVPAPNRQPHKPWSIVLLTIQWRFQRTTSSRTYDTAPAAPRQARKREFVSRLIGAPANDRRGVNIIAIHVRARTKQPASATAAHAIIVAMRTMHVRHSPPSYSEQWIDLPSGGSPPRGAHLGGFEHRRSGSRIELALRIAVLRRKGFPLHGSTHNNSSNGSSKVRL